MSSHPGHVAFRPMVTDLAPYTTTIAASIVALYAVQVPLPVEMTALVMVGIVLRWSIGRTARVVDTNVAKTDSRVTRLEMQVAHNAAEIDRQRHFKHHFLNQITAVYATMVMVQDAATRCDCAVLDPFVPVLDRLIVDMKESIDSNTAPETYHDAVPDVEVDP